MERLEVGMAKVTWVRISLTVLACWAWVAQGQALNPSRLPPDEAKFCPGEEFHPRVSSGTMAGQLISRPDPIFPPEAAKAHVSGSVVLRICIGTDGHVKNLMPISGPEMLRKSYIDAVSRWVYRPYMLNGVPVPVMTTVTLNFEFGGG